METKAITYIPKFKDETLRNAIQQEYTEVACNVDHQIHFISGLPLAKRLGYPEPVIKAMPSEAIRPFAGVGNPFSIQNIEPTESVLDIGCGAGFDLLTAWLNGSKKVDLIGLDITEAMIDKARQNIEHVGAKNIRIIKGYAESIPLPEHSIDVVISNGVINLCPDKLKVYKEIYRILKPGGRIQIADVILSNPVPNESRDMVHLWTNCVAGGIPIQEYIEVIHAAGFSTIEIHNTYDVFKDARIAKSAAKFGAKGYNIKAIKSQ